MPMWLNLEEVATLLGERRARRRSWIEGHGLPAVEVGGRSMVNKTDLLEWALAHGVAVDPGIFRWEREREDAHPASLVDALEAGRFASGIEAEDARSAIIEVMGGLPLPGRIDRAGLVSLMLARVSQAFLDAGGGLLVPSPEAPLVVPVDRPALSIGVFARAIDLNGERKGIRALILLASPTIRVHLKTLAGLSAVLGDPAAREALTGARDAGALSEALRGFETRRANAPDGRREGVETR